MTIAVPTPSGEFVELEPGAHAFVPVSLPPALAGELPADLVALLSEANLALGRLDGIVGLLPDPGLFIAMYARQEALLSSQIEGTQSTLEDLLAAEAHIDLPGMHEDVVEVENYLKAMNLGLERVEELPISKRLIREIHAVLLAGSRGSHRDPGQFRRTQVWVGPEGSGLANATVIPPPPGMLEDLLDSLELFLQNSEKLPSLVHAALAHCQFETIHPFLDGNGRVGRLLITFLLVVSRAMDQPLLYLSLYLRRNQAAYYEHLNRVRLAGDWRGWLEFFLRGVVETASEAYTKAMSINAMRSQHRTLIEGGGSAHAGRMLDLVFEFPIVDARLIAGRLQVSYATANRMIATFEDLQLLVQVSQGRRNRVFAYEPYLALLR